MEHKHVSRFNPPYSRHPTDSPIVRTMTLAGACLRKRVKKRALNA
jgi:hypothetical protein